jgi:xylan 1,4-beta-xylosidase
VNEGRPVALSMNVRGLPAHPLPAPAPRDEFDGPLGPQWNYLRNPVRESYSTSERPGWLRLRGTALTLAEEASPTFVGRRQQHLRLRAATRIAFAPGRSGGEGGLVLYRAPDHRYELGVRQGRQGREVFVRQTIGRRVSVITARAPAPGSEPLVLQVEAEPGEYTLSFGPSPDRLTRLDAAMTRYLSSEVAGGFVGTYVGLYATGIGSRAAFDWFLYEPRQDR